MLDLILAVNLSGTKIPSPPPLKSLFCPIYISEEICDAVKKLFSILQSMSNQVSVLATNVLMGAVCKKFENFSNLFSSCDSYSRKK